MSRVDLGSHEEHAEQLRSRVANTGVTDPNLRLGVLARGAGGPAVPEPYDALAWRVALDSSSVSDGQVQAVCNASGSEKAAFELLLTAAVGAGLRRWDAAEAVIKEAGDAAT